MGLSLFSVESLLTCKVFVLKYWTQVLLCCVLPVKTHFFNKFCEHYQSYDIFRHKAKYLWTLMLMILSYGWSIQKLSKYQVGIKLIMIEKLIWTPNSIYDVSWRVLKSSWPHEFVEILFECRGVNEGTADMQHCWPYQACCMIDSITGCIWS